MLLLHSHDKQRLSRSWCAVYSPWFERASGVLILFNVIIMGLYEYNMRPVTHRLQQTSELVLAFVFLAEAILRFVAKGARTPSPRAMTHATCSYSTECQLFLDPVDIMCL